MQRRRLALVVLAASALGALTAELALRAVARATRRERGVAFDAELGWRMLPNVEKRGAFWGVATPARTNSHGWRDRETPWESPDGRPRLVVVGDSFTFGVGVDADERWTDVLEELVPGLDVVNLGMNAIGTDQELLVLERDGLRYGPALVVCQLYDGNDFRDVSLSRNGYLPKPHFRLAGGALELVPPRRDWDSRLRECGYLGELAFRVLRGASDYRVVTPEWRDADTTPLLAALLERMRTASEGAGAGFLVLVVRSPGPPRFDALAPQLERAGVETLDSGPLFADPAARAVRMLPDDHWTPAGHRAVAGALAAELERRGGIDGLRRVRGLRRGGDSLCAGTACARPSSSAAPRSRSPCCCSRCGACCARRTLHSLSLIHI